MTNVWHKTKITLNSSYWVLGLPYAWLILFFILPFIIVLKISFSELRLGIPPYGPLFEWVGRGILHIHLYLTNYMFIISDSLYIFAYMESLWIAGLGTLGCLLLGYPIAYGIVRSPSSMRTVLLMMVILPFWTSFLLRVYAWMGILSPQGFLNSLLIWSGLITSPLQLLNTTGAAIMGIIYSYLPFMILPLYTSLEKIDRSLLEAAYDLGARPYQVLMHIIIPLSLQGVFTGAMLVMIPAVGEFVIPELLGGPNTIMIGKMLWNEFFTNRDWPVASALAIFMLIFLVIPIMLLQQLQERQGRFLDDHKTF